MFAQKMFSFLGSKNQQTLQSRFFFAFLLNRVFFSNWKKYTKNSWEVLWVESLGHHFGHVFGRMDSRSFMIVQKKIISSFAGYLWFSVTKNSRIELWNGQSCLVLKIHFGVWWFWTLVSDRKKWIYSINFWMISFARRCFSKKTILFCKLAPANKFWSCWKLCMLSKHWNFTSKQHFLQANLEDATRKTWEI